MSIDDLGYSQEFPEVIGYYIAESIKNTIEPFLEWVSTTSVALGLSFYST